MKTKRIHQCDSLCSPYVREAHERSRRKAAEARRENLAKVLRGRRPDLRWNPRATRLRRTTESRSRSLGPWSTQGHIDGVSNRFPEVPDDFFSIDQTCCGKCTGGTCYVDQVTGA